MNTIIELVRGVRLNRCLLRGKVRILVEGIESKKVQSKEDAIEILFKHSADPKQSLNKLLKRTKQVLITNIITSPFGDSPLQKVYNELYAGFSAVMILFNTGKRAAAISEAKRYLNLADKYELIDIALPLALKLSRNYADIEPNSKAHRMYSKLVSRYNELARVDVLANQYYSDALISINNRSSYTKGIIEKLNSYTAELSILPHSAEVATQYFTLEAMKHFANMDYARASLSCKTALKELNAKATAKSSYKNKFLLLGAVAAIAARQVDTADKYLQESLDLSSTMGLNWQITMYYRTICALHAVKFYRAEHLYEQAAKHYKHKLLEEYWAIIHAYLSILNGRTFRLGKFFNETIEASQDKAGLNIHILIADLLISLRQNRDRFLHRLEAVRNYSYRHLKGKATERVRFFLDILFLVPKCDFDRERLEKASRLIQLKLGRRSIYANHNLEIEVVPFEVLVGIVMEGMDVGRRKRVG